jgi:hypothetical protein
MWRRFWEAITDKENPWFALLVFGVFLAIAAFLEEIPKTGIKIKGSEYQPLLLACGAVLLLAAVGLAVYRTVRPPVSIADQTAVEKRRPKINVIGVGDAIKKPRPRKGEKIPSPVMITGTVSKPPPEGWVIYLVGVGSRDQRSTYFPYQEVSLLPDRTWSIEYKSGSGPRKLQLYLVGEDGQALMKAFWDVNREHLNKSPGSHAPLRALTSDMLPACDPLHVHIAEPQG